jgi:hypothetical protein
MRKYREKQDLFKGESFQTIAGSSSNLSDHFRFCGLICISYFFSKNSVFRTIVPLHSYVNGFRNCFECFILPNFQMCFVCFHSFKRSCSNIVSICLSSCLLGILHILHSYAAKIFLVFLFFFLLVLECMLAP